jgi:hypothetical protein
VAGHPLIGFWDADLATPCSQLRDFLEVLRMRPQTDLVLGSRVKLLGRHIDRKRSRHYIGASVGRRARSKVRAKDGVRAVADLMRLYWVRWRGALLPPGG